MFQQVPPKTLKFHCSIFQCATHAVTQINEAQLATLLEGLPRIRQLLSAVSS